MKGMREALLKLNNWKSLVRCLLLIIVAFVITGCGDAVKIIVVPAAAGGTVWVAWLFIAMGVGSVVDPYKPPTPEQIQQQNVAVQQQETEKRLQQEMDLPAGLTPSSENFVVTYDTITCSIAVIESKTLSPDHNFQVYSKMIYQQGAEWQREEIVNIYVSNPDNLENAGLVDRRLLFSLKNSVNGNKVVIMWED